jgi:hypothetical protein
MFRLKRFWKIQNGRLQPTNAGNRDENETNTHVKSQKLLSKDVSKEGMHEGTKKTKLARWWFSTIRRPRKRKDVKQSVLGNKSWAKETAVVDEDQLPEDSQCTNVEAMDSDLENCTLRRSTATLISMDRSESRLSRVSETSEDYGPSPPPSLSSPPSPFYRGADWFTTGHASSTSCSPIQNVLFGSTWSREIVQENPMRTEKDKPSAIPRDVSRGSTQSRNYSTTDPFTDDDVSTTSSKSACDRFMHGAPSTIVKTRPLIRDYIIAAFRDSYRAFQGRKCAGNGDNQGKSSSSQTTGSSSHLRNRGSIREGAKRPRENESEKSDDENAEDKKEKGPKLARVSEEETQKWLACPFYKKDPIKYKCCQRSKYDAINRLK